MVIYIAVNIAFHGVFALDEMVAIKEDPLRDIPGSCQHLPLSI